MKEPYFERVTVRSWIAEDGSHLPHNAPRVTGFYFRKNPRWVDPKEIQRQAESLSERLLIAAESGPNGPESGGDGGAKVPAPKPPNAPTPISGTALALPKILRP